ncbi:MAG TPA: TonB-dependent receptor [Bryobacteraceae bacterium]|nr:TonB-dependent receptor [Bryobacteraceae bacterium]
MRNRNFLFAVLAWGLVAGIACAQSTATLTGTVVDESNALRSGTAVTATEISTGQQYTATSDDRGVYRIVDMLPGTYKVQAMQTGFATLVVANVQLLVGQTVTLPLALKLASVSQTIEVSSEAPLINTENQKVGGNIDRMQMDDVPILGRNIQTLSLLVKGVTANDANNNSFGAYRDDLFQVNVDGQQITQGISISAAFGQPIFSRDAVAEFQLVTNQYDITQGRSEGEQVNIITRSGTNEVHATAYGNFRRDDFNASDFVAHKVLPYSQSIIGGTVGGPVIKDKLHYFLAYEYQSTPSTVFVAPPIYSTLPSGQSSLNLATPNTQYDMLARGDYNLNEKNTFSLRGSFWNQHVTACACATSYPTAETLSHYYTPTVNATWTNVLTPNVVQEAQAGYFEYFWRETLGPGVAATPYYNFSAAGLVVGPNFFYPENFNERIPSVHYNISVHHGTHDLKFGAEALWRTDGGAWPSNIRGNLTIGTPTDIPLTTRFPLADWNDPSAWNLSGLGPLASQATQNFYPNGPGINMPRHTYAVWAGDTWHPLKNLTITLGLRWDADLGQYDPPGFHDTTVLVNNGWGVNGNVGIRTGIKSLHDWAPRGGFSYALGDGFVIRAGAGVFYSVHDSQLTLGLDQQGGENIFSNLYLNPTHRTDFLTNWANGLTAADYASNPSLAGPQSFTSVSRDFRDPRAIQATFGLQKQLGSSWSIDSDFIFTKGEFLTWGPDVNQNLDVATGYPFNPNFPGAAPRPNTTVHGVTLLQSNLHSQYVALASSVTKRFSRNWQAGLTYTLMFLNDDMGNGSGLGFSSISNINNPACATCEWGRSGAFQRGTLRLNAIYHGPWGMNLSGIFYYGSGNYFGSGYLTFLTPDTSPGFLGTNRRVYGTSTLSVPAKYLDRWNGPTQFAPGQTIPRSPFHALPIYKVDLRLSKDFKFHDRFVFSPMVDVFNLFNHPNYGSYNTSLNLPAFGTPSQNGADSYVPREFQFAFHFQF